ncbi:reverse transcriptase-like protein [Candidatus Saccharibacteria bacterium]|nr:reverse transcriptase-like protein [Candidatus Saccharibacteria bacterium]
MKQLISVRAIIKDGDKTLLVRRANGRQSILGKYELPGGKLDYSEQPEDALRRHLLGDTGLTVQTAQLFDVLTYVDHDDRDIQYTFILYLVAPGEGGSTVTLSPNYDKYAWRKVNEAQHEEITESARLLLGIATADKTPIVEPATSVNTTEPHDEHSGHFIIYSDGGSRGNPGPSASGFIIMNGQEEVIHQGGEYLGITTNNQAEYHAVRLALEKAHEMAAKTIDFRMDSLLVVNQLNGIYKIRNHELWPIYERIKELAMHFENIKFSHVRREFNKLADGMVNKILDAHAENPSDTL